MKIRAAVSRKGQEFPVLEEVELGAPLADEILVRIVACGICRTDLDLTAKESRVFGHFFGQSSFAEFAIAEARSAVKVPSDLPLPTLAPLGCGVSTGAGAVFNAFAAAADDTLAIFGTGAVGLSAVMAAKILGLKHIIAIDRIAARLQLALELGATDIIDTTKSDVSKSLRALSPRGFDFALNTTTSADALTSAVECLAMRGTAGFVAAPQEPWSVPAPFLLEGGRTLRAILGSDSSPQKFLPHLIEHYRAGKFSIERLITLYPFADIEEAMNDLVTARVVKPVLLM
ncbi:MAG: zinc-binding dehydrogenase [Proteobacteria bacterium]|nr:zinc-binding dehydrogenase [Pseudomonadota bacterium]